MKIDPKRKALQHVRVEDRGYVDVSGLPSNCLIWTGAKDKDGYGVVKFMGRMTRAHHIFAGIPPVGFTKDHLCRQVDCVRPSHLEDVTRVENLKRSHRANPRTGVKKEKKEQSRTQHLSPEQVAEIRKGLAGGISYAALARKYKKSTKTIKNIAFGLTWRKT